MRKFKVSVAALTFGAAMFLMTSCIGSFGLFNKVLKWNRKATNNKFVNELIFLGLNILPVYEFSILLDYLLFNSLEFWTGNSPMSNVDKTVKGEKGEYHVKSIENGYELQLLGSNKTAELLFNAETQTWSLLENGSSFNLVQFVDDNNARVFFGEESMVVNANNTANLYAAH